MSSLAVMKGVAFTRKRLLQWLEEDGKVVVQTKRDEIRCMVKVEDTGITFTSASGKPLYNIGEPFANLFAMLNELTGLTRFDCGASVNNSFDLTRPPSHCNGVNCNECPYNDGDSLHRSIEDLGPEINA